MCNPNPTGERPWPPGNPHGLRLSYARLCSARATVGITPRPGAPPPAAANISDGSDISIAVNGVALDELVFHSFSEDLNSDGVRHALSGVEIGGESISVGFEDLTGGGDRDFEDVVFRVEMVDDFLFG